MDFGVFFQVPCANGQSPEQRYAETIAQVQLADELGFDTAWLAELHFHEGFSAMPAPLLMASAIAQVTRRVRIGIAVNLVPLHHPIRLAEETAVLDLLSHGRAIFGVGRGSIPNHFEGYGVSLADSRQRYKESLEIIIKAWTTEEFSYEGQYYSIKQARVVPKPFQRPHPPIYGAANSPETFYNVGSAGYNLLISPVVTGSTERAIAGLGIYRQKHAQTGHDSGNSKVSVTLPVYVTEDRNRARAEARASFDNYLKNRYDMMFQSGAAERAMGSDTGIQRLKERFAGATSDQIFDEIAVIGDPAECMSKLSSFRDTFMPDEFTCSFNLGGLLPHQKVEKSMRLFAEKVAPHFK